MLGTLINVVAVVAGSVIGILLGNRLPKKVQQTVLDGLGLMVLVVGISMAIQSNNILIPMVSVLLGGIAGELLRIEDGLEAVGRWLELKTAGIFSESGEGRVVRGFVTASLVFCVGPLAILGAIQDGLTGDYNLLAIKSMLDAFASLAFAAALGPGVILSALSVGIYQGTISLAAMGLGTAIGDVSRQTPWVVEMTAAGGVLIMGIGLVLLELKRVRVGNLLPAVFIAPLIVILLAALGIDL
ncbi:MAG: DUF554 domain-containing protein [Chloroflexota bacterium]|nr:DUF554 domain-containing protein [Chloroflexota bacterium]